MNGVIEDVSRLKRMRVVEKAWNTKLINRIRSHIEEGQSRRCLSDLRDQLAE